jgi:hypothetical protein
MPGEIRVSGDGRAGHTLTAYSNVLRDRNLHISSPTMMADYSELFLIASVGLTLVWFKPPFWLKSKLLAYVNGHFVLLPQRETPKSPVFTRTPLKSVHLLLDTLIFCAIVFQSLGLSTQLFNKFLDTDTISKCVLLFSKCY